MTAWARDDVRAAFEEQLRQRQSLLSSGAEALGWKLGAGTPAAMAKLGIDAPLIGYLLRAGEIPSGGEVAVEGWTNARLETEIAVRVGESDSEASGYEPTIEAIALAFELVDVDVSGASAEEMLRRNVFHRALVLGEWVATEAVPPVSVFVDGRVVTDAADPLEAVGGLAELVNHVAEVLAVNETALAPGSVILTGAVALPPELAAGQRWTARAPTLGEIAITVAG
jgi:2-keto-4-pentenoate hydratase